MNHLSVALENLVGEFGILSGHLVSVKTTSTKGRVAGRHRSLSGFACEDRLAESFAACGLGGNIGLWVAGVNLRCGRGFVRLHLAHHFLLRLALGFGLLAGEFHLLLLGCGLLRGLLLHLLLLLLRGLLLLLAWTFASTSSKPC
jgi:hypothetical protein